MLKFFIVILFSALILNGAPKQVWFEDIRRPSTLNENACLALTGALKEGLAAGKNAAELAKLAPADPNPRVIFLTLGDGIFPARTYYAAGADFRSALHNVLTIMAKREPEYVEATVNEVKAQIALAQEERRKLPEYVRTKLNAPGKWNSLRMDIVQSTLPVRNFAIPSNMLLLSSTVGIAFDSVATFAFTPEQLTGRCLMTAQHQLSIPRIANIISESTNWAALRLWLQMGTASSGFNVTIFECDSYLADAEGVRRLFRSRPVEAIPEQLTATPAAEARELALRLTSLLSAKGQITVPFPEWIIERADGKLSLRDRSEMILALCRTANMPEAEIPAETKQKLLTAALNAVQPLFSEVKRYDANEGRSAARPDQPRRRPAAQRTYACAVESEEPEAGSFEEPRRLAALQDSAIVYLAFAAIAENLPADNAHAARCRQTLPQLYRHIMVNIFRNGKLNYALLYPEMKPILGLQPSRTALADTMGLVGLAMQKHLTLFPEEEQLAGQLTEWRQDCIQMCFEGEIPADEWPHSPWMAEFLATGSDKASRANLLRMALNAAGGLEKTPPLPDMYGAPADVPSMTWAAERLWIATLAERHFRGAGLLQEADTIEKAAWPLWVFARQAKMESAAASILPHPQLYPGFCRDNMADFGFTMNGQTTHIFANLTMAHRDAGIPTPSDTQKKEFAACWKRIDAHPLALAPELIVRNTIPSAENNRALAGQLGEGTIKTSQAPGRIGTGTVDDSERMSSRILKSKRKK